MEKVLDLSGHNLVNTELVTRIYTYLLQRHSEENMWHILVEFESVRRDIRMMDRLVTVLKAKGQTDEEIYQTIVSRVDDETKNMFKTMTA